MSDIMYISVMKWPSSYLRLACMGVWFLVALRPLTVLAQQPFTCKGQYYLSLTKSGNPSSGLYEVRFSQNGQSVFLDTISPSIGLVLNAMGYRITDNLIYGMDPGQARLRKIGADGMAVDLGRPQGIPVGPLYYAGDVTPDGRYLLLIGLGGQANQIVRVDLEDPMYTCSFVPMQVSGVGIVDIAFDPFTGILYGHDLSNKRMVIVDPLTGAVDTSFPVQPQVDQLGALFFDSFGNLFGYGAYGTLVQDKFVAIDKKTGIITLLAQGPVSSGQDGCACPYTLELQKTVTPEVAHPCTEVVYNFIVSNGSGILRSGITLTDSMPKGLLVKEIIHNPYGGTVSINENILSITGMDVNVGIDTIKVLVEAGPGTLGIYRNQATLTGLPLALGSFTLSDNPATFLEKDSTDLLITPWDLSFLSDEYHVCAGDSVRVDATVYGISVLWDDGDTRPVKWLRSPGRYRLKASSLCEDKIVDITVSSDLFSLDILEDSIIVNLGESAAFTTAYNASGTGVVFLWSSDNRQEVLCPECPQTSVVPLEDGYYSLLMQNDEGCKAKDQVFVRVVKKRDVYYPNIISANGDGSNDRFFLTGNAQAARGVYLWIYDRWGNKVFDSSYFELNDSAAGWDGTFKKVPVVPGVYTWTGQLQYIDGFVQFLKGDLTVIR